MKLHDFQDYSHGLETVVHDTWITTRVKSALALADTTLGLNVHVRTHAGAVALSGRVNTHRQCEQAVALARTVPGVVNIDASELLTHVFTPGSFPEAPNAEDTPERRPQSSAKTDDK
ncbi:BON domain-containing protein [Pseudomonas sp. Pseusp11]|uniref:BON domain-containing protein n=1 Tax=Pseudomonas sp. Pseusp11 TaxID=3243003 RepID=UPI0039B54EBF